MVMRVSENMKFNTMIDNMFKTQSSYNKLMEKIVSQKEINRPSDDPIGMVKVLDFRESRESVEQYLRNIGGCESWLTITESKLSAAGDLLIKAREVAAAQSTETATAETRSIEAEAVQQLIGEMFALANSKYEGRYLFSGTKSEEVPFSSPERGDKEIGDAAGAGGNTSGVDVTSSGTYEGLVNKTYVVKITNWDWHDDNAWTATYDVSADGGETWISTDDSFELPDDGEVTISDIGIAGDGINLTFTDNGMAESDIANNDIFYVQALATGYYNGNGEEMSVNIGEGEPFAYSVSGEEVFTDKGEGNVDILSILNRLEIALESNDSDGIASCIDHLEAASDQIIKNTSMCGTKVNRLEIAKNNLADLDLDLTGLISNVEDADITEVMSKFAMKEIALKASYAAASRIGNLTILNFIT